MSLNSGQNESLGVKEELKLHLDYPSSHPSDNYSYVNVTTPPRVLTLEELPFPTLDDGYGQRAGRQPRMNGKVVDEYRSLR